MNRFTFKLCKNFNRLIIESFVGDIRNETIEHIPHTKHGPRNKQVLKNDRAKITFIYFLIRSAFIIVKILAIIFLVVDIFLSILCEMKASVKI